jgi:hypothetical protein
MNAGSRADDENRREFKNAIHETAARVAQRGVYLSGGETHSELVELEEALEQFERAVQMHGGDLMVDEAPAGHRGEPDDPRFMLPERVHTMAVADYISRLARAIDGMRKRP